MKSIASLLVLMAITSVSYADSIEICVSQAGISSASGFSGYTYAIGIGPNGADQNPITPLNEEVDRVLAKAVIEMNDSVNICMKGTDLKFGRSSQFMVFSAVESAY